MSKELTHAERKERPVARGVLDYFPDAIMEVALVSKVGNDQHNPGQPMHWAKEKSIDEADALVRHLMERGTRDSDGMRHSAKVAWRALAMLQREIDAERDDIVHGPGHIRYMDRDGYIGLYREELPMADYHRIGKPDQIKE